MLKFASSMDSQGIKLTFLGTGTSTGVPALCCECEVCCSSDPRDHRLRSSVLIQTQGKNLLIDPGPDFRFQALRAHIRRIDAVLITHSHYDHVGGIDDLRPYCHRQGGHLPVYCTRDVAEDLKARVPYCFAEHPYPGVPTFAIHVIDTEPFEAAGVRVIPIPVWHHKEIRGFRIGPMAYITDCKMMPEKSLELLRGVDVLVLNALRFKPHATHLSLSEALDLVQEVKPRRTYFTHMADAIGLHAKTSKILPPGISLAYDQQVVKV